MKVVTVMEKPSAGRNGSTALGGMKGTFNGESYSIVCARGHLFEYKAPAEQVSADKVPKYKSWDPGNLPFDERDIKWEREKKDSVSSVLNDIKAECKGDYELVCATDLDPSGEGFTIFSEIVEELKLKPKKISRMYFTDESPASLQKAFKNRVEVPNMYAHDEYLKATYRSRWDWLSIQFTRVATAYGDGNKVLREGRLKSVIVLLVGDQQKAIAEYKKIPFYQNRFRDENGVIYTNPDEPVFPKKEQVPRQYKASSVTLDETVRKRTAPPKYLDLASLSARLATKGFKPKQVTDTYQKMYEHNRPLRNSLKNVKNIGGVLSYPRTEDKTITPEQFNDLLPYIDMIAGVVGVDVSVLTHRQPRNTHVKAKGAHGANRPGLNVPNSMQEIESLFGPCGVAIYELLAKNYLASIAEDYEYDSQKGHVTDYPKFVGSAQIPKKAGWKAVYDADDDEAEENAKGLGKRAEPYVFEGFPPKPVAPTMKWLVNKLESYGIGTGATRTSTIVAISSDKDKYQLIKETRGKLSLAECGEMSYRLLPDTHIGSLEMTKKVQDEMDAVAKGELDMAEGLRRMQDMVIHDIAVMKKNGEQMRKDMGITIKTGGNGSMEQAERFEGIFKGKQVNPKRVYGGHRFTDQECEDLLAGKEIVIEQQGQKGPYKIKGKLSELTYNGHKYIGFERLGFANDDSNPPAQWCGHKFTDDEMAMLKNGQRVALVGCKSKKGNVFDCHVTWEKGDDGKMAIKPDFN